MSLEGKLISSVLNDKQIHVLMQNNARALLKTHGDIFDYVLFHYDRYQTVPSPEVVLEKFPDFDYYEDTERTKYHLDELRSNYLEEGVKTVLREAAKEVQRGETNTALDTIIQKSVQLRQMTSTVRDLDVGNAESAVSYYEQMAIANENGTIGVKTGLEAFDVCLPSGISPGHFGVILAYPAIGKSWLMAYFAVKAWENGKTPLIVSLEMTEEEVRNRIYTIIGSGYFSHRKLSSGKIDVEDFKRWHSGKFNGKPPIHIISNEGLGEVTPAVIQGKINQYRPDIVFLDYLNLMSSNEKADNETVKMKQLSRQLKILAVSEHVPIVAISSATPDDVSDMNSAPTLGQVAWSKQISYDADWLIALGREVNSDVVQIVFRKNRHGSLGEFYVIVDFDAGIFTYRGIDP